MAQFLFKRSGTADKRPDPTQMAFGELDLNYDDITGGIFYKNSGGTLIKVGPAQVSATAPNATPVGSTGNALGEFWYDTGASALCIWDGAAWQATGGGGIPPSTFTACGDLIVGTGAGTYAALPIPRDFFSNVQNGCLLTTCSTEASGLAWITPPYLTSTALNASSTGALIVNAAGGFTAILPGPGEPGQVLTNAYNSGDPGYLAGQGYLNWCTPNFISQSSFGPGALVVGCTPGSTGGVCTIGSLTNINDPGVAVGYYQGVTVTTCTGTGSGALANVNVINVGYFPSVDSVEVTQPGTGYALSNQVGFEICGTTITTTGAVCSLDQTTICKAGYLSIGTDGQVLTADSTCALGVKWAAGGGGTPEATPTALGTLFGLSGSVADNTSVGLNALCSLTTGCLNVAMGVNAAALLTTGRCNTVAGFEALKSAVSSRNNVAIGYQALCTAPSGNSNVAIGMCSLFSSIFGYANVAVGCCAGFALDSGAENTLIGDSTGSSITTGNNNVVIGSRVDVADGTASSQLAIGFNTSRWLTGDSNFAIKPGNGIIDCAGSCGTAGQVLMSNGSNAICWGAAGGASAATPTVAGILLGCTTTGNTGLGCNALLSITTGASNTALGLNAGCAITTGCCNTATGLNSQLSNTTGNANTASGQLSLACNTTGSCNAAFGFRALNDTTGADNTAVGAFAGCNITTGIANLALGCGVQVASPTDSCQLALGFSATDNWLTGDSTKAIKPGAGIFDCSDSTGGAGQALMSNGANALCWGNTVNSDLLCCSNVEGCGGLGGNLIYGQYIDGTIYSCPLYPGYAGQVLTSTGGFSAPLAWCNANYVCGACFTKGSIPTGCIQSGGGVGGLSVNGTGNDPGVAAGYYTDIPLTGGTGADVTANVNVISSPYFPILDSVQVVNPGTGYLVGDDLTIVIGGTTLNYTVNVDSLNSSTLYNYTFLPVGTNDQVLTADSACTNGIKWATSGGVPSATPTVAGVVFGCTATSIIALGSNSQAALTTGDNNVSVGLNSLCTNSTGSRNTAVGSNALCSQTGNNGTAVGFNALLTNIGDNNTAVGLCAAICNSSGSSLTAVGANTLLNNTTGFANSAFGAGALTVNNTGQRNVGIGYNSLTKNTAGSFNVGLGDTALGCNTTGGCNVGVGFYTLALGTTGCFNVALGHLAGCGSTGGDCNVVIGPCAQVANLAGSCQLAVGFACDAFWLTGKNDKAIRPGAGIMDCGGSCGTAGQFLMSNGSNAICWGVVPAATPLSSGILVGCTASGITAVGNCSLACLTTGSSNTAVGINALRCTTSGCCNAAFGINTLIFNTTGSANVAFGNSALGSNTTGSCNVAVGHNALANGNSTNSSVAIGMFAMCQGTANGTTAIGTCALKSLTTGVCNTAVGCGAMSCVTTGSENVAVGYCALLLGTGSRNVALGSDALVNSNGCDNVAVGFNTLVNTIGGSGNVAVGTSVFTTGTGSCNIGIGFQAACDVNFPTGSNNIVIGCCAATPTGGVSGSLFNVSNRIVMGNSAHTCAQIQVAWSTVSDVRDKALDPAGVPYGLLFVEQLEPIAYRFCDRETNEVTDEKLRYGFSAQNVRGLEGDTPVISNDDNLERLNITDSHLLPVLVNAIKELSDKNKLLEERIANLEDKA